MSGALVRSVALWCALLAADRIDVLAGYGPFVLTPFLVVTPLLVLLALREPKARGFIGGAWVDAVSVSSVARRPLLLLLLILLLSALVTLSVFSSMDLPRSAMRTMQLVAVAFGVLTVRLVVPCDALAAGLVRGARWGIGFYALICLLQLASLLSLVPAVIPSETLPVVKLLPSLHGGLLPRLSGPVVDSNRSGLLLLLYAALLLWHDWRRHVGMIALVGCLLLLTLSRSSLLAGAAALLWVGVMRPNGPLSRRVTGLSTGTGSDFAHSRGLLTVGLVAATVTVLLTSTLLLAPRIRAESARIARPIAERFSVQQGSGEDHLRLLARGVETGTRSVPNALRGIGYGSAFLELQDFFPGDRYGNFHSVYVGLFAESGIFALLVLLLLLGVPVVTHSPLAPLAIAAAVFGVFYGALAEPTYWLALVLAWLPLGLEWPLPNSARPKANNNATAPPSIAPSSS